MFLLFCSAHFHMILKHSCVFLICIGKCFITIWFVRLSCKMKTISIKSYDCGPIFGIIILRDMKALNSYTNLKNNFKWHSKNISSNYILQFILKTKPTNQSYTTNGNDSDVWLHIIIVVHNIMPNKATNIKMDICYNNANKKINTSHRIVRVLRVCTYEYCKSLV